jgi:hypothetical protein
VAVTLVRLRELAGATDVELGEISRPEQTADVNGAPSGASGDSDCGAVRGQVASKWSAVVSFDAKAGTATSNVPKSLGGGA